MEEVEDKRINTEEEPTNTQRFDKVMSDLMEKGKLKGSLISQEITDSFDDVEMNADV
jgi:hypothetical protein